MRRILFVNHTGGPSGPTSSLLLLVDGLRERFALSVAHPGGTELRDALDSRGIQSHDVGALSLKAIPRLTRLIKRQKIDLVYSNNTGGASRNVFLAARIAGVPFICHVRGMSATRGRRKLFYLPHADAIVAVSHAAARAVRRFSGSTPVHVVHNGVRIPSDLGDLKSVRARIRSKLEISADAVLYLQAAHVCPRKGQHYAVEQMSSILQAVPGAVLAIAGGLEHDSEYTAALRVRIESEGIGQAVRLLGFRSDVPDLMAASDVFVHTAVADPHPRAVIEAMAWRLPVVAFSVDGVAETVVDGETGRLVPAGDGEELASAMAALANDPTTRVRMAEAGVRRAREQFSDRVTTRRVAEILQGILSSSVREPDPIPSTSPSSETVGDA